MKSAIPLTSPLIAGRQPAGKCAFCGNTVLEKDKATLDGKLACISCLIQDGADHEWKHVRIDIWLMLTAPFNRVFGSEVQPLLKSIIEEGTRASDIFTILTTLSQRVRNSNPPLGPVEEVHLTEHLTQAQATLRGYLQLKRLRPK